MSHVAEQFSWIPLPYCSPPGCPLPIKSLALSDNCLLSVRHEPTLGALEGDPLPTTKLGDKRLYKFTWDTQNSEQSVCEEAQIRPGKQTIWRVCEMTWRKIYRWKSHLLHSSSILSPSTIWIQLLGDLDLKLPVENFSNSFIHRNHERELFALLLL